MKNTPSDNQETQILNDGPTIEDLERILKRIEELDLKFGDENTNSK